MTPGAPADTRLRIHLETLFREELQDDLGALSDGLRELEHHSAPDSAAAVVQDLFRTAHSLKGAAHSAGVTAAVQPCTRLEERLAAVREGQAVVDRDFLNGLATEVAALAEVGEQLNGNLDRPAEQNAFRRLPVGASATSAEGRTRVAVRALDQLVHEAGDLVSVTGDLRVLTEYLAVLRDTTGGPLGAILSDFNDLERLLGRAVGRISDTAQRLRMQSIGDVAKGLDQSVNELCRATGKQTQVVLEGGDVELDRDVADAIREPLLHLVRNAVDHGIELPESRLAAGKAAVGTVRLSAVLDGGRVRITVSDDGAGLDVASIRTAAGVGAKPGADTAELAFHPGVSTAPSVTDVSGRGIGLDAVRARIEALGGSVRLQSTPDVGTDAVVFVPTTLAVIQVILVRVASELVALPVATVERVHRVTGDQIESVGGRLAVRTGDEPARTAVSLGVALGLSDAPRPGRATSVVQLAGEETVLLVDAVEADHQALLQPLPRRVNTDRMLLGAIVLANARVVLVVNPSTCIRAASPAAAANEPAGTMLSSTT